MKVRIYSPARHKDVANRLLLHTGCGRSRSFRIGVGHVLQGAEDSTDCREMAWVDLIQSLEFRVCSSLQQQQPDYNPVSLSASCQGSIPSWPKREEAACAWSAGPMQPIHSQQRNTPKVRMVHMASQTFPRGPTEQESMNETANID
jgi:hypothetical protein